MMMKINWINVCVNIMAIKQLVHIKLIAKIINQFN